jgi:hypothetical protein
VLNVRISSRLFSRGFDISTPVEDQSLTLVVLTTSSLLAADSMSSGATKSQDELGPAREKRNCSASRNPVGVDSSLRTELR